MTSPAGFKRIARTLRHRNFRLYVYGSAVSLIGTWMQRITVGWLTWELTGSGFWLGLISCADLLPAVLIGPFGGVLADRTDCRRIIMTVQSFSLCQALALGALTALGEITVELLALLILANGIVMAFYTPARLALTASLLPRADLATGIALNSIVFNLARFIGPALAGLVILTLGPAAAFAANAFSFLAFLLAVWRLRLEADVVAATGSGAVLTQLAEGLRYTVGHRGIGPMLLLLLAASLGLRPVVELMPGFAAEVFAGGADTLALLSSSVGIGAVVSGALLARRGGGGLTRLILQATLLLVLAILGFVATDVLWLATLCITCAGMCMVTAGVSMQTLMQMAVDGALRGRVLSLYGITFIAGPAAGALIMGTLSERLGLRLPLAGGAVLVLLVWLWAWRRRHAIAAALEPENPP